MFSCLEKRDRWILLRRPVGQNEVSSVPSYPRNVLVFPPTCHHDVVAAIPTEVLTMGILGVTAARSWWCPHFRMLRDFWESTCRTPSGIPIFFFADVGLSRSPPVGLPVWLLFWACPGFLGVNLECS